MSEKNNRAVKKHNDEIIADGINAQVNALALLAKMRLDFIEERKLIHEYHAFMVQKRMQYVKEKLKK